MKSNFSKIYFFSAFFLVTVIVIGCKKDKNADKVITMEIASKLDKGGAAPPASPENPAVIYYMNATDVETNEKYGIALGRIEGFDYVEGYEYVLKVLKTTISDPPADGHAENFKLIEVISKTKDEDIN